MRIGIDSTSRGSSLFQSHLGRERVLFGGKCDCCRSGKLKGNLTSNVRMLVYEGGGIVDLVMYDEVQILLGRVFRDVRVCEFLVCGHVVGGV